MQIPPHAKAPGSQCFSLLRGDSPPILASKPANYLGETVTMRRSHTVMCVLLVAVGLMSLAIRSSNGADAPGPRPGHAMIEKYLAQQTAELSKRVLDGGTTG